MVGQIQSSDRQSTPHESAPETLECSLSDDEDITSYVKEPSKDTIKPTTIFIDEQIQVFRDLCHKGIYFQVDTPSGRPMKALILPLIEKSIISSDWVAKGKFEPAECPETNIKAPWSCNYKSSLIYFVEVTAGTSTIETYAHVVPHFQDGIDVIFGKEFWIEQLPTFCGVQTLTTIAFDVRKDSERPLNIKGLPLERVPFSLPLELPELVNVPEQTTNK